MEDSQRDLKKKAAKERIERMVELMLISEKGVPESCPLREVLKKSFSERVLWLEEQTQSSLDSITAKCRACGKCKFDEITLKT
ncbi:MAG: hypothetical protein LBR92_01700 [Puniceicoccales bacterium]|jgi:hypothetical protein|nr:hypothetical protein [Puniceicoccales bacterium]